MNFALMQHHGYRLEELENMLPWEREIYLALLMQYLEDKRKQEQMLQSQAGISHG
jgi:hypothetical protein